MEVGKTFVNCFGIDLTSYILGFLNDPADLIRFSAVSHSLRHCVIENEICKQLCLRKVPQITDIAFAVQESDGIITRLSNIASTNSVNWETLVTEHKIYSSLLHTLSMQIIIPKDIIGPLVGVLSIDPYLEEDFDLNSLPSLQGRYIIRSYRGRYPRGSLNLSTKGESDSNAPEYIMSRLKSGMYIMSEVDIWFFKAPRKRVCPAKSMRFRIGHPKSIADDEMKLNPVEQPFLDKYEWTYTSPLFRIMEEACSQQFKLLEPVICAGDFFLVELFGWAQRDEADGLFSTSIASFEILGQSLEPACKLEVLPSGELQLNYFPHLDFVL